MRSALVLPAALVALIAGCDQRPAAQPTAEERVLLDRIEHDFGLIVAGLDRNEEQRLIVLTRQGDERIRYVLEPDVEGGTKLAIRRALDDVPLPCQSPERPGVHTPR